MKKKVAALIVLGIMIAFIIPLVNAAGPIDFRNGMQQIIQNFEEIFTPVFEFLLNTSSGEYFFAKIMILLLLFIIIATVTKEIPTLGENRAVVFIVAAVVSVFAVRYMPDDTFVTAILLPYTTLGTAIAVFLPYLVYLFFTHQSVPGSYMRKAAWIAFGIIFIVLWAINPATSSTDSANWIHLAGLVMIFVAIIWDRQIHMTFERMHLARSMEAIHDRQSVAALEDYRQAVDADRRFGSPQTRRNLRNAERTLRRMAIDIPDV
jgi:hypothetical protein